MDSDFKTRVIGGSRSPHGYLAFCVNAGSSSGKKIIAISRIDFSALFRLSNDAP
jgi:hypothetical protein